MFVDFSRDPKDFKKEFWKRETVFKAVCGSRVFSIGKTELRKALVGVSTVRGFYLPKSPYIIYLTKLE